MRDIALDGVVEVADEYEDNKRQRKLLLEGELACSLLDQVELSHLVDK
jgi:hypothetical protein